MLRLPHPAAALAPAASADRPAVAEGFDFLEGRWIVHNPRIKERLVGSMAWETFDATPEAWLRHPSGNRTPSQEHLSITRKPVEAGRLLRIAEDAYTSLAESGCM